MGQLAGDYLDFKCIGAGEELTAWFSKAHRHANGSMSGKKPSEKIRVFVELWGDRDGN